MKLHLLDPGQKFYLEALPLVTGKVIYHGIGSSSVDFGSKPRPTEEEEEQVAPDRTLYGRLNISRNTEVVPS